MLWAIVIASGGPQTDVPGSKAIELQIKSLRSLADDVRAVATRRLALEIRDLPASTDKVSLAVALSNLSTEGDFGHDTLQEVANTLAVVVQELPPSTEAYAELARLVHYEHVNASQDAQLSAELAKLDADYRARQDGDFTLPDLRGKSWTLRRLRGNVVLVNFWATWCPPCRKEMPDLEKLYQRFKPQGLIILAISDEPSAKVAPFIEQNQYTYPILLDSGRKVHERFRIQGIPKSLVYDRDGKLVAESPDMRTSRQFLEMLSQAGLH